MARRVAEVAIAWYEGRAAGFALFFHSFSTFLGQPGIYLEDLFVVPSLRGRGVGRVLLSFLAKLAVSRGCGRLEWAVIDRNEPAIRFYKRLGAQVLDDRTTYRLAGDALEELAES
jgi:GNAT superfamily N-acetyltransferase